MAFRTESIQAHMKDSPICIPACDWDAAASLPQSWGLPPAVRQPGGVRLSDVGEVEVRLVREPKWTPRRLSGRARRVIGPREE